MRRLLAALRAWSEIRKSLAVEWARAAEEQREIHARIVEASPLLAVDAKLTSSPP